MSGKKQIERMVESDHYTRNTENNASGVKISNGGRLSHLGGACHAWTNSLTNENTKAVIGFCRGDHYKNDDAQHFLSWLFDPERSFYSQLIKYYGKDFHIVYRHKKIYGFGITNFDEYTHNHKILHGIFKATRTVGEHYTRFSNFYGKWAIEEGYDPIIVWPLVFYLGTPDKDGTSSKAKASHCSFDNKEFNLEHFANINHGNWDVKKAVSNYGGEATYTIGSGFDPYEHMLSKGYVKIESRFYSKYNTKNVKVFTEDALHNFFKEWNTKRYKEFNKCVA